MLKEYENLSTCDRLHVAALLVKDGRILSVGYNGTPAGAKHCNNIFFKVNIEGVTRYFMNNEKLSYDEYRKKHHEFSEANEIHAETNCICMALKNGVDISGCSLILSVSPCQNCAKMILTAGIKEVYYVEEYDGNAEGITFLKNNDVKIQKI